MVKTIIVLRSVIHDGTIKSLPKGNACICICLLSVISYGVRIHDGIFAHVTFLAEDSC